ncbi:hypothetical protein BLL52_1461 [Rhodoferax antarcticus ANT.BR]|uniref:Uncharacterized protein n=1 Tax=Rhodoferax antarcticus ANT.BR TaxID=1111071 RepID=A0A1Q8YGI3_9BURK|nr:hypothetical protein BLL52_1461 [Rhodoferax antarcticus ANT.BR]
MRQFCNAPQLMLSPFAPLLFSGITVWADYAFGGSGLHHG